ncbi:MAG: hypothetical protein AB7T38_02115 [Nitrospirales bacterium]
MNSANMTETRNWMSYLLDSLVNSGAMPAWEAVDYLTGNLVGEAPNSNLHQAKSPYEAIQQFLHRVYGPIVEAASRTVELPPQSMIHMFTDVSLMGKSAVLVVYYPGQNQPHQLLLLDAVPAWDLTFETSTAFDQWAEERYGWIVSALQTVCRQAHQHTISSATEDLQPV